MPLACGEAPDPDGPDDPDVSDGDVSSSEDSGAVDDEPPVNVLDDGDQPAELTPETDGFISRVHNVVMQTNGSGTAIQVVAIDGKGMAIGVLTTFADQHLTPNLEANFSEGYLDVVVLEGEPIIKETLPPEVLAARAAAMVDLLPPNNDPKSAFGCAVKLAMAIALCAPLAAGPCSAGVITAFCECASIVGIDNGESCDEL